MLLPPKQDKVFKSEHHGRRYLEAVARYQGYALSTKSGKGSQSRNKYYYCSRGYQNKNRAAASQAARKLASSNQTSKRVSSSMKTGCMFGVSLNYRRTKDLWVVKVQEHKHNHSPFEHPHDIPSLRRLTQPQIDLISTLTEANVPPQAIRPLLGPEGSNRPMRDIYNARALTRQSELAGKKPITHLIRLLQGQNWFYRLKLSSTGTIQNLFFAHPGAIAMGRRFPHCFGIDCTYKTNRYKLPLCHIVGSTCFNSSFSLAFCFMQKEDESEYTWVLEQLKTLFSPQPPSQQTFVTDKEKALINAISKVFPESNHMLCVWHVNKSVLVKCKPIIRISKEWDEFNECWQSMINSPTLEALESNKSRLTKLASKYPPRLLNYLEVHWYPILNKIVQVHVSKYLHFGSRSTSRVEGSHWFVKRFLRSLTLDLLSCFKAFNMALKHQHIEFERRLASEKQKTMSQISDQLSLLHTQISQYAIRLIDEQLSLLNKPQHQPCTGSFTSSFGLPCSHQLGVILSQNSKVSTDAIHSKWMLTAEPAPVSLDELKASLQKKMIAICELPEQTLRKKYEEISLIESGLYEIILIEDPMVKCNTRGRPTGSKKDWGKVGPLAKRNPSAFEYIESSKSKAPRKCTMCSQPGHYRTSCPKLSLELPAARTTPLDDEASDEEFVPYDSSDEELNLPSHSIVPSDSDLDAEGETDDAEGETEDAIDTTDDNQPLCPFCDKPLPSTPSINLQQYLDELKTKRNAKKTPRPGNPDAISLPLMDTITFCNLHQVELEWIPLAKEHNWPTSIDFNKIPK